MSAELFNPAVFSRDRLHRYSLSRLLTTPLFGSGRGPVIVSCGYNPSTADELSNDQTIAKEFRFSKSLHWAMWLIKVNLFAAVSTNPDNLIGLRDPVGPDNDEWISKAITMAEETGGLCIASWGAPKGKRATRDLFSKRERQVSGLAKWQCFGVTKDGHPRHPLYLPNDLQLSDWITERRR